MWHRRAHKTQARGFTIIEVMIVIAIAGMLLVMVFIGLAQLSKSRRDLHRRHFAEILYAAEEEFYVNNHHYPNPLAPDGPAQIARFKTKYAQTEADPSTGQPYNILYRSQYNSHSTVPALGEVIITARHWCNRYDDGDNDTDPIASPADTEAHDFVIVIGIEKGQFYCVDNHVVQD